MSDITEKILSHFYQNETGHIQQPFVLDAKWNDGECRVRCRFLEGGEMTCINPIVAFGDTFAIYDMPVSWRWSDESRTDKSRGNDGVLAECKEMPNLQ